MTTIEKAQRTAATLREVANKRVIAPAIPGGWEIRDAQADAMADLAELVLALVATDAGRRALAEARG